MMINEFYPPDVRRSSRQVPPRQVIEKVTVLQMAESRKRFVCPACGGSKSRGAALCIACLDRVPEHTAAALKPRGATESTEYQAAIATAFEWLGVSAWVAPPPDEKGVVHESARGAEERA